MKIGEVLQREPDIRNYVEAMSYSDVQHLKQAKERLISEAQEAEKQTRHTIDTIDFFINAKRAIDHDKALAQRYGLDVQRAALAELYGPRVEA